MRYLALALMLSGCVVTGNERDGIENGDFWMNLGYVEVTHLGPRFNVCRVNVCEPDGPRYNRELTEEECAADECAVPTYVIRWFLEPKVMGRETPF